MAVGPTTSADAVVELYQDEIRAADVVIASRELHASPAWWPVDIFATMPVRDLRHNILAVLVETACHAGHLDAVRELLDSHQNLVAT